MSKTSRLRLRVADYENSTRKSTVHSLKAHAPLGKVQILCLEMLERTMYRVVWT